MKQAKTIKLDFKKEGYFIFCDEGESLNFDQVLVENPWSAWCIALNHARTGEFEYAGKLLTVYDSVDYILERQLCVLFGDAAPSCRFDFLSNLIRTEWSAVAVVDYCDAIVARGNLKDVPLLLNSYRKFSRYEDASIIPYWIDFLIGKGKEIDAEMITDSNVSNYNEGVNRRFDEIVDKCGGDDVIVFNGCKQSMYDIVDQVNVQVLSGDLSLRLRRKFEAMSGISCAGFFENGRVKRKNISEVLEKFTRSEGFMMFEEGSRYFFGRKIP